MPCSHISQQAVTKQLCPTFSISFRYMSLALTGAFETLPHHSPPSCLSLHNPTCLEHHSLHHPVGSKV